MDNNLESKVNTLLEKMDKLEQDRNQSRDITSIVPALIKAQGSISPIGTDRMGVHARYATLPEIWEAIKVHLQANDLFLTQGEVVLPDKSTVLVTTLMHKSGQFISTSHLLRSKAELQGSKDVNMAYAGQLTYFKRYSLCGLLAIFVDRDLVEEGAEKPQQRQAAPQNISGAEWVEDDGAEEVVLTKEQKLKFINDYLGRPFKSKLKITMEGRNGGAYTALTPDKTIDNAYSYLKSQKD
jgi:hypothetical protein